MEVVELMIAHSEKDRSRFAKYYFVNTADQPRAHDYSEINQVFLAFWISWKHITKQFKNNLIPDVTCCRALASTSAMAQSRHPQQPMSAIRDPRTLLTPFSVNHLRAGQHCHIYNFSYINQFLVSPRWSRR